MNARIQQLLRNVAEFFLAQPPRRRLALVGTGAVTMALVLGLAWWVQRPVMRPLFTNLSSEDAGSIVAALREQKVEYELEDGGRAVLVPADKLYDLRLTLATRGLPEGGGVGFELFDKQSLGQTDFLQHLNYQRALQGELARTIAQLGGVERARVHLALPERSLFVAQDRKPSASVVIKLAQGRTLSRAQVDGIVHLVSASVEGMDADGVTVVDESGHLLTADRSVGVETGLSADALDYQRAVERAAAERVENLLATVVGPGKVMAQVSAKLELARAEKTEERYDPDGAVVKQQQSTKEETAGAKSTQGGAAGTASNLTNDPNTFADTSVPKTSRKEESSAYDVSKTVTRTIAPVGTVQQLSVAVIVDGTWSDENGKRTFVPRSDDEMERLTALAKSAVGFDEERGDKIQVTSAPFQEAPAEAAESALGGVARWAPTIFTRLLGVALVLVGLLYVVRPLLLTMAARRPTTGGGAAALEIGDLSGAMSALTQENLQLTQSNPERAAQLVREWLSEDTGIGRSV
jgi:flagellar M-ring protein FliF